MSGPLSHIKVLDLSRVLAAPWAAQNLADLGAEVIKVERPLKGDDSRAYAPPYLKDEQDKETRESAYFCAANRGKKSITVNISKPEGQQLVRELAKQCDVLIENYKVGDLARYGLGYDDLKKDNPGLIYCSVTGFGQTGPDKDRPGYDFMAQGMGGLMSITGERDDLPGGGPQRVGVPIIDLTTGMYATIAICAAIANRAVSGKGQWIDVALLDSCVAFLANQAMNYFATGESPRPLGNAHPNIVPYQTFKTADGALILACGNDNLFNKFCDVAGCAHLAKDPRFSTNGERVNNRDEITRLLNEIFLKRPTREWVKLLDEAGVANGPINTIEKVFEEPQVQSRGMKIELPHAVAGKVPLVASPMKFSGTPIKHEVPPPALGQHTDEILGGVLKKNEAEIARLKAAGIV
ncbi:MAG TPA: CaiB/BaiF CoA-transferase family protein [Burkholderiales bacterium]|nr:CaiB/BaiF CoA-transferase family protein [Burkholderiales bacterium]